MLFFDKRDNSQFGELEVMYVREGETVGGDGFRSSTKSLCKRLLV